MSRASSPSNRLRPITRLMLWVLLAWALLPLASQALAVARGVTMADVCGPTAVVASASADPTRSGAPAGAGLHLDACAACVLAQHIAAPPPADLLAWAPHQASTAAVDSAPTPPAVTPPWRAPPSRAPPISG